MHPQRWAGTSAGKVDMARKVKPVQSRYSQHQRQVQRSRPLWDVLKTAALIPETTRTHSCDEDRCQLKEQIPLNWFNCCNLLNLKRCLLSPLRILPFRPALCLWGQTFPVKGDKMTKPMIHNSKSQSIHTEIKSVGKTASKKFWWNADFFLFSPNPISLLAGNSLRKQWLPNGRNYYSADAWLLEPFAHPILERILMERYQSRFFSNEIIRQPSAVAHCLISTWQLINEEPLIICHSF